MTNELMFINYMTAIASYQDCQGNAEDARESSGRSVSWL